MSGSEKITSGSERCIETVSGNRWHGRNYGKGYWVPSNYEHVVSPKENNWRDYLPKDEYEGEPEFQIKSKRKFQL